MKSTIESEILQAIQPTPQLEPEPPKNIQPEKTENTIYSFGKLLDEYKP